LLIACGSGAAAQTSGDAIRIGVSFRAGSQRHKPRLGYRCANGG
jgi:hypothetical protein